METVQELINEHEVYFWCLIALCAWVMVDSLRRGSSPVLWTAFTLLVGPLTLPFYFAKRKLLEGEIREGG